MCLITSHFTKGVRQAGRILFGITSLSMTASRKWLDQNRTQEKVRKHWLIPNAECLIVKTSKDAYFHN